MVKINSNFSKIKESYLFSEVAHRVDDFLAANPGCDILRLGIGDVTRPVGNAIVDQLVEASREQGDRDTFMGYGPEQGHRFLIDSIIEWDYSRRGISLSPREVFISDGAKSDLGNIGDILSVDNLVAVTDPVYPVYLDTNIMAGRRVMTLPCTAEHDFIPQLPQGEVPDIIYLCYPNNPTGMSMTRAQLALWVDYALEHGSLILFDSAYEAYIQRPDVPHSIYEIKDARKCAIEFRSFSKTAGFTGLRCGYTVVPLDIEADGVKLNKLWRRRQCTKFNGASYIVQRAASAIYTDEGQEQTMRNISYYMNNARELIHGLAASGLTVYGGVDSPYVWAKAPAGMDSWSFFDLLLNKCHIVATPGVGFGECGEGYMRFTSFNTRENTIEASRRISNLVFKI
ncbi:MAG: LL-diaminopimelate aminotransferase [Clostridiales bacterium]|nr:LL-diaminopimelate aminotransferase [Clostridiales bacterium]